MARVRDSIESLSGVEVHATDGRGKLVVTMETASEQAIVTHIDHINGIDGILSAVLIYHHSEDAQSLEEELLDEDHAPSIR